MIVSRKLLAILCFLLIFTSCVSGTSATSEIQFLNKAGVLSQSIVVEIAETQQKRTVGLMHRKELPSNGGMLFIFPVEETKTFWMKDTPLSLDIVFIDKNLIVRHIHKSARPYSTAQISSLYPCKYVLEIEAGKSDGFGIEIGSVARLPKNILQIQSQ